MCDCYWTKCQCCDKEIPVHIADFNYPRTDVEVWCQSHIPDETGIETFIMMKDDDDFPGGYLKGTVFAIRLKHGELRPSDEGVEINLSEAVVIEYHPSQKTMDGKG